MTRYFVRAPGAHFAPLGDAWGAFSSLSGESHIVNDESIAMIEALDEAECRSEVEVCHSLAQEYSTPPEDMRSLLQTAWEGLISAGLVREVFP